MWMSWKHNSKIIKQIDIDYLCYIRTYGKSKFCELFIPLPSDTTFKSPNGKLEYTILPYIEQMSKQCQVSKFVCGSTRQRAT